MSLDEVDVSFANNLGLSTRGFLLLPWQLLSYSFVADWFANFSDYISASLPSFGYKQLGSCLVEERVIGNGYTLNYTNENPTNYTMNTAPNGTVGIISVTKRRTALEPAGLVIKNDFRFDKFTRLADALTLFSSRFGGLAKLGPFPNNSAFRDKKAYARWADNAHL
jgi:hypothetical protein